MTNAEGVLVNQAKKGDAHGFALLYQRYYKELFYFALSVMKNASQAEDAVSAGVLKAYEQIGSLRKNSSFKSWLFQITANECRKMLRKTVYSLEDASLKEPVGEEAGFEEAEIREYLKVLNGTERMFRSLSGFGGYRYSSREIGKILGKKEGTIRSLKSRALAKLREQAE